MIYELRIYEVVPGPSAGLEPPIRDDHHQDLGSTRHQAGRLLDGRRRDQQRADLPAGLGEPGRARAEVEHVQADPEWNEKRAQTEANGPIVARVRNSFLRPTSYSSVQ